MMKFLVLGAVLATACAQVQVAQPDFVQVADPQLPDVQDGVQVAPLDQVQVALPDQVQVANPDGGSLAYGARRRRFLSRSTPQQDIPSYDQQEEEWVPNQGSKHNLGQDGHGQQGYSGRRSEVVTFQQPKPKFYGSNHPGIRSQQNRLGFNENPTPAQYSDYQQYQYPRVNDLDYADFAAMQHR